MAEYIEREAALNICQKEYEERLEMCDYCGDTVAWNIGGQIKKLPAADVEEVKHGKWIGKQLDNFRKYEVICSNCDWIGIENYDSYDNPFEFNYCPNCGAKMNLED
jgi:hypothetical protein